MEFSPIQYVCPQNRFPSKWDAAFPVSQLEAFLRPLIHPIYRHVSSRPQYDAWVRNGKGQHLHTISPIGTIARSSSNFISTNNQGVWKAKYSPHIPAQDTIHVIHPKNSLGSRDVVSLPGSASGRGTRVLPVSLNHSSYASLWLLETKEEGSLFF